MFKINLRSVAKAAKGVAMGAVGVTVPALLAYAANPEVFAPLYVALGPYGLLAAPAIAFGVQYAKDAWVHRAKKPEGEGS